MKSFSNCPCLGGNLDKLVQPAILASLIEGAVHGYLLTEKISRMSGMFGDKPDVSGVYRSLRKMEASGLLTSSWRVGDRGHAKRLYEITADGRECLGRWASTLETYLEAMTCLLGKAKVALARGQRSGRKAARRKHNETARP
jgi:DNA-binding PadR family transcriptional regulator